LQPSEKKPGKSLSLRSIEARSESFRACEVEKLIEFLSQFDNRSMNGAFVELIYNNLFILPSFLCSLPVANADS
jgi:hypothetical protein